MDVKHLRQNVHQAIDDLRQTYGDPFVNRVLSAAEDDLQACTDPVEYARISDVIAHCKSILGV